MSVPNSGHCWHCWETGHWVSACELLKPPQSRAQHTARLDRIVERLGNGEIGQTTKRRLIKKENELWEEREKEIYRK